MSTQSTDRKLPLRVLVGLPLANFGPTLQTCIQMYFLLFFFTNILGISATAAAAIIFVARIWDFINDPLMAVLVEKFRRPQKCLFLMRCALVPVLIFWILTYTAPNMGGTAKIVWAAVMFIGLGMSQTAYSIPLNTLRPKLTTDKTQRAKLNTFESAFSLVANLIIPTVTMPFVAILQGYQLSQPFMILVAIYAVVYLVTAGAGLFMLRGSEIDDEADLAGNADVPKITTKEMFHALMVNKVALLVLVTQVIKMFISSTIGSSMVYYFQYNLNDTTYALMSSTSAVSGIIGILPILFLVPLYKKFGNAGTALLGCIVAFAAMLIRFVTHDGSTAIIMSMVALEAIGGQLIVSLLVQCLMDSIDYGEWKTGKRNVPVLMSAYGIGTKIGLAFGSTIAGLVIGSVAFDPTAATQPQNVLDVFFHTNITISLVMYAGMAIVFWYLRKIEKKLPEMRAEVEARKAATAQEA